MKKLMTFAFAALISASAFADGQVFYRYGFSSLTNDRGSEIFTDTLGTSAKNNDKSGNGYGAGLDLKMMNCPLFPSNSLVGEIFVDYNRFSNKVVTNAIGAVSPEPHKTGRIAVSELAVVVAPKYRFDGLGNFRPWIVPVGLAFLVNNPPSYTTSYLDVGFHAGAGAEYMVLKELSVGVDYRYTAGAGDSGVKVKYGSFGTYLGINF